MNKKTLEQAIEKNKKLLEFAERGLKKGLIKLEDYNRILQNLQILQQLLKEKKEKGN